MELSEPVCAPEPVQVRKRNHIWANVFDDEEEDVPDKENGYERRRDDHDDVDEDEMLYVRGASPTSRRKRGRDRSPHQYSFSSHGKRSRSPAGHSSSKAPKRPREEPDEQEDEDRTEGRRDRKKRKKKHKRKSRESESSKATDVICTFYMKGMCNKGSTCLYSHQATPLRRNELCKYYLMDVCARGDKCLFMHQDFPCKFYHMGNICTSESNCKFSHAQLSDTMRTILLRYLQSTDDDILKKTSSFHRNQKGDVRSSHSGQEQPKYESEDSPVMRYSREASPSSNGHHSVQDDGYAKDEGGLIPCFPQFYKDTLSAAQEERQQQQQQQQQQRQQQQQQQQAVSSLYSSEKKAHSKVVDTVSSESSRRKKAVDSSPDSGNRRKVQSYNLEKQKELYLHLQGKVKKEPEEWTTNVEIKTEPLEDDNWYSSDEEDAKTVQVKQEYPSSSSANSSSEINVSATLSKLLSVITKKSNGECSTQNSPVQDPRHKNPVPSARPSSEPAPPPVINIYGSAIFNIPGNGNGRHTAKDSCRDKDSSGLLNLPFKPAPFHAPATEIYASETSHPPIEYHVAPVSIPTPDYRHLRFKSSDPQVHSDPRLRKLYRLSAKTSGSADFRPVTPRSDPRRRSSTRETAVH